MVMRLGGMRSKGIALLISCWAFAPVWAKTYLVKFDNANHFESAADTLAVDGLKVVGTHAVGQLAMVSTGSLEGKDLARALASLMQRDGVQYVVENFKLQMLDAPNDPQIDQQWSLKKVGATSAWEQGVGSRNVVVAVIDTGVDFKHPDLAANMWKNSKEIAGNKIDDDKNGLVDDIHGYDFLDNDADPSDVTSSQNPGHGTHCAGIVGAVGNNAVGISGMSQEVAIMALRFIGPDGSGDLMAAIKAIDYAIAQKADIISASWGAQVQASQAQPLIEAIGRANEAGITFVAAAANSGANNDSVSMYPANADFPNVIAVAASDVNDGKPSWSNFGKAKVALAAPGADILSTLPQSKYGKLSGTSMATPMVAGMIALLQSQATKQGKAMDSLTVRSLLQSTGAEVAIETACMCRVDAAAASAALAKNQLIVVPAAVTLAPDASQRFSAFGGAGGDYSFSSSDPAILDVAADGTVTAKGEGEAVVKVSDSRGVAAESRTIRVVSGSDNGGGGGGGNGECPLQDPALCQIMCMIDPTLPWCSKQ